ncbi:hypothetical protein ACIG5E_10005 [Kitasatospora sp. NPDC053057]|uniref:hypothetical protein n=1 Tax=Kitasatospora sp. NPDC053057 TaxID=3364062 RepID=UPI0037C5BA0A
MAAFDLWNAQVAEAVEAEDGDGVTRAGGGATGDQAGNGDGPYERVARTGRPW